MLTDGGACASCPGAGFPGFALQKPSLLDLELAQAVEVICTFSKSTPDGQGRGVGTDTGNVF